ncbi:MAG TPA: RNA polymerase sigma factor [Chloroflexota bacterium]|nr:RNA polymerase sigma factor [Chloroflexota bacterium]
MELRDRQRRFDAVYLEYRQGLHAYFLGRTSDPEQALDLLQECFLRVWRGQASLEALPPERRRFWLFSVARNLVVDHHRRRAAGQAAQAAVDTDARVTQQWADPPEHALVEQEDLRELDRAIRRLPDDLRVALVLQVVGGQTSAEIGEGLGQPPGTVRYHLAQARRRLADELRRARAVNV